MAMSRTSDKNENILKEFKRKYIFSLHCDLFQLQDIVITEVVNDLNKIN